MLHNSKFDFNENLIEPAVNFWMELIKDRFELNEEEVKPETTETKANDSIEEEKPQTNEDKKEETQNGSADEKKEETLGGAD